MVDRCKVAYADRWLRFLFLGLPLCFSTNLFLGNMVVGLVAHLLKAYGFFALTFHRASCFRGRLPLLSVFSRRPASRQKWGTQLSVRLHGFEAIRQ